jgi:hypothetical protein
MRINDRSGPGIETVSTGDAAALAPVGEAARAAFAEEKTEELTQRLKETTAQMAEVRRGSFIIGYPLRTF